MNHNVHYGKVDHETIWFSRPVEQITYLEAIQGPDAGTDKAFYVVEIRRMTAEEIEEVKNR